MSEEIDTRGWKVWRILRCSENEQEAESFPQQIDTTDRCAERCGLEIIDTTKFPGYSATQGQQVGPLLEIIQKRRNGEVVFDAFLLDGWDRWIRSEADEARLFAECRDAELNVITEKDGVMFGVGNGAKRFAATTQSEGFGRDLGRNVNRKVAKLMNEKKIPPVTLFPWGIDREYYDKSGKAIFRVRAMQDRRKAILDAEYPHAVQSYISAKFRQLKIREADQTYAFVPGDPVLVSFVKRMFRDYYINGLEVRDIQKYLNAEKCPPKRAAKWTCGSVRQVLRNPLWFGLCAGYMNKCGTHLNRTAEGPRMLSITRVKGFKKDGTRRKTMKPIPNAPSNWIEVKQPQMESVLDEDVRILAKAQWEARKLNFGVTTRKKRTDTPPKSSFILANILTCKGREGYMRGHLGSKYKDTYYRYYYTKHQLEWSVEEGPTEGLKAEGLEEDVKDILRTVLQSYQIQSSFVRQCIDEKKRSLIGGDCGDSEKLEIEKLELEDWYTRTFSTRGAIGQKLLASRASEVEDRLQQIERQLVEAKPLSLELAKFSTEEILQSIEDQMREISSSFSKSEFPALHRLAKACLSKLEFDPVTRTVEVEVSLPTWALTKRRALTHVLGGEEITGYRNSEFTNTENIVLSSVLLRCPPVRRRPQRRKLSKKKAA